jgi:hypothetical protein
MLWFAIAFAAGRTKSLIGMTSICHFEYEMAKNSSPEQKIQKRVFVQDLFRQY